MPEEAEVSGLPDLDGWVIAQVGDYAAVVFHADMDLPGWTGRPWVRVRALTDHEALEREGIGIRDLYLQSADDCSGVVCERTYDFAAMAGYDFAHCVVDFWLPKRGVNGEVVPLHGEEVGAEERAEVMLRLPQALGQWVRECVDRVNLRRLDDRHGLEVAKKN